MRIIDQHFFNGCQIWFCVRLHGPFHGTGSRIWKLLFCVFLACVCCCHLEKAHFQVLTLLWVGSRSWELDRIQKDQSTSVHTIFLCKLQLKVSNTEKQQKMWPKSWNSIIWQIKFILSVPIYCVWSRKLFLMKILCHYFTFRCIHFCGTCSSFTCTHSTTDVTHISSSFQLKFYAQILHQCIVSSSLWTEPTNKRNTLLP